MFETHTEESCLTVKQSATMITSKIICFIANDKNTFSMLTCQKENWKIFRLKNKKNKTKKSPRFININEQILLTEIKTSTQAYIDSEK